MSLLARLWHWLTHPRRKPRRLVVVCPACRRDENTDLTARPPGTRITIRCAGCGQAVALRLFPPA